MSAPLPLRSQSSWTGALAKSFCGKNPLHGLAAKAVAEERRDSVFGPVKERRRIPKRTEVEA
jgi:hypothetical protein